MRRQSDLALYQMQADIVGWAISWEPNRGCYIAVRGPAGERLLSPEVVVMGAVTGAIGTYVVLRGLSFMGDALAHAIFPGVVIAFLLDQSIFVGALAFGVLTSVCIGVIARNQRVREDSAVGVLFPRGSPPAGAPSCGASPNASTASCFGTRN